MALFTDGEAATIDDLASYEAEILELASAESIDLNKKLAAARNEIGAEIETAARSPGNVHWGVGPGWNSTGGEANVGRFRLDQVVVTPSLRMWHVFQTLAAVFRDLHNRKINDRYLPKQREYKGLARWAADLLFRGGIGLVSIPIPRGARPRLDTVPSTVSGGSWFVSATWTRGSDEGCGSRVAAISTADQEALRATPGSAPGGVTGWNVYIGREKSDLRLQNADPLDVAAAWVMAAAEPANGRLLGDGQSPEMFRSVTRVLQRG